MTDRKSKVGSRPDAKICCGHQLGAERCAVRGLGVRSRGWSLEEVARAGTLGLRRLRDREALEDVQDIAVLRDSCAGVVAGELQGKSKPTVFVPTLH